MLVGIIRKHDRVYEFWVVGDPVFKLILVPALFNSRDLGRVASLRTTLEESTCIAKSQWEEKEWCTNLSFFIHFKEYLCAVSLKTLFLLVLPSKKDAMLSDIVYSITSLHIQCYINTQIT